METVVQPPSEPEIRLLTDWVDPEERSRTRKAAIGTVLLHVAAVVILVSLPAGVLDPKRFEVVHVTPLIEPLTELTQKAPNKGKVTKEFDATELNPRPRIQIPAGRPSTTRPEAPRPAAAPSRPASVPALPEPPKVESAIREPSRSTLAQIAPQPQILTEEKPKLAFENPRSAPATVPPGQSRVAIPNTSVSEAIHAAARGGAGGGYMVGDPSAFGTGGYGEAVNLPPSAGSQASGLRLMSDPQGVDFHPYLVRILASVKQHWLAVLPESVRLGRHGRVEIQFSIDRSGVVPKLVIANSSGTDALDRAAVAGISASVPFPPLPTEYKGQTIRLQFNFAYNMPHQ